MQLGIILHHFILHWGEERCDMLIFHFLEDLLHDLIFLEWAFFQWPWGICILGFILKFRLWFRVRCFDLGSRRPELFSYGTSQSIGRSISPSIFSRNGCSGGKREGCLTFGEIFSWDLSKGGGRNERLPEMIELGVILEGDLFAGGEGEGIAGKAHHRVL